MTTRRKFAEVRALLALGITLVATLCWLELPEHRNPLSPLLERLDLLYYDIRFNTIPLKPQNQETPQRIVIVDIDERSLKTIGHWPWSRQTLARLVDQLHQAGAASITFDVVFSEPEPNIALRIAHDADAALNSRLQQLAPAFDFDQQFANSLRGNDVTIGYIFHADKDYRIGSLPESNIALATDTAADSSVNSMSGFTASIPVLAEAAHQGYINGPPDPDGIVRRAPLVYRFDNRLYPSLALQTAMTYLLIDSVTPATVTTNGVVRLQSLHLGNHDIHTDHYGQMLIPYRGRKGTFPYIAAADILNGTADTSLLNGSMVLVGTSAIGLVDLRTTPVGTSFPGIESQANIVDALLRGDAPYRPDWASAATLLGIIGIGLPLAVLLPFVGPGLMTILGLGSLALLIGTNSWFWHAQHIDLPIAGALIVVMLLYGINLAFGFFSASQQKERIRDMFGQYVAPAHIERLLGDPAALAFTGESKQMTVLFSDVRSFTTISEALSANELKTLLNRYFTPMTEIIFAHAGTIDKYVGDMIMAFWGAPLDDPQQQKHAIITALAMQKRLALLRQEFAADGLPEIHAGIGINTGMMNVGDMGSSYRRAYTVLGDAVNLGSRLESITKYYGVGCLVSESTRAGLENDFLWREIDYIQVKGKHEAIHVFEPICTAGEADAQQQALMHYYAQARQHYLRREWEQAAALFNSLQANDAASTRLYQRYLDRIALYQDQAPPDDWCGIWRHDEK